MWQTLDALGEEAERADAQGVGESTSRERSAFMGHCKRDRLSSNAQKLFDLAMKVMQVFVNHFFVLCRDLVQKESAFVELVYKSSIGRDNSSGGGGIGTGGGASSIISIIIIIIVSSSKISSSSIAVVVVVAVAVAAAV